MRSVAWRVRAEPAAAQGPRGANPPRVQAVVASSAPSVRTRARDAITITTTAGANTVAIRDASATESCRGPTEPPDSACRPEGTRSRLRCVGTRGRPPIAFTLSEDERVELTRRLRAETTSRRDVRRARVILECAEGGATGEIARRAGVSPKTVERWRGRFARAGLEGLVDDERSGRPSSIPPMQRFEIIAAACAPVPPRSDGVTAWTLDLLRESILSLGIVKKLSRSGLHRLLDACDVKPFHVRGLRRSRELTRLCS